MPKEPQVGFRCTDDFRAEFMSQAKKRKTSGQAVLEAFARKWIVDPFALDRAIGESTEKIHTITPAPEDVDINLYRQFVSFLDTRLPDGPDSPLAEAMRLELRRRFGLPNDGQSKKLNKSAKMR